MNISQTIQKLKTASIIFIILSLFTAIAIYFLDKPLVLFLNQYGRGFYSFFDQLTNFCDLFIYSNQPSYLSFGFLRHWLLLAWFVGIYYGRRVFVWIFLQIIFTHWCTTLTVSILKITCQRARPEVFLKTGEYDLIFFFGGGDSFPSGHVGDYMGFFLPLALWMPKYSFLILLVPGLISLGRLFLFQHYLSDVLFSLNLAIFFSLFFQAILSGNNLSKIHIN
jgi:membrane-associated phospholipid phosphatase